MDNEDFLLISDPKILDVPVRESNDPLVDLKNLKFHISPKRADNNYEGFTLVRQTVAQKLLEAKKYLPEGIDFLFEEGHRPLSIQRKIFDEYYHQLEKENPDWTEDKLKLETSKYVALPENVPPHSTGGAFDITLIDSEGVELDMGSTSDDTPDKNENRNYTFASNISDEAKRNRQILINALEKAGFVNYPAEWWHWSYGDKYWAYCTKNEAALYGRIDNDNIFKEIVPQAVAQNKANAT